MSTPDSGSGASNVNVLGNIVIAELTRHLNNKSSEFEATNDQP